MTEEELKDKIDALSKPITKHLFVLDGKKVVPCRCLSDWGEMWTNNSKARTVAVTYANEYTVSTMFVGMESFEYDEKGNPLVFETMIFGGKHDEHCYKHGTWEDAELGHIEAVKIAMGIKKDESD